MTGQREEWIGREIGKVDRLEAGYRKCARQTAPADEQASGVLDHLRALQGMERCIKLRMQLMRELDRVPPEPEPEEVAEVDLSKLSDGALRELRAALKVCNETESDGRDGARQR